MGTVYLKLTITGVLWGGIFIAGRIIAGEVPPFTAAFLRFSWSSFFLFGFLLSRGRPVVSPEIAVAYPCLVGTMLLAIPASAEGVWSQLFTFSLSSWVGMFYLGFFGSFLGFRWYYEGIQAIGPARAGVFINLVPLSAVVMAVLFLGEQVEVSLIVGALAICLGVTLTNGAEPVRDNPR